MRIHPDPEGDRKRERAARGRRRPRQRLRRALAWLGLGFVLVTVTPVVALRGWDPPGSAFMMRDWLSAQRAGRAHFSLAHAWVAGDRISRYAALAVIAAEDQKFHRHMGFDLEAMRDALDAHRGGRRLRGASTITQQVAKNLFLWPGRSWLRKGLEAWFTLLLELLVDKPRILEIYLNVAQFGDGVYGVEAASQRYFGKPATKLGAADAALLAAVLPNPLRLRVDRPSAYVRGRQRWILDQMRRLDRAKSHSRAR